MEPQLEGCGKPGEAGIDMPPGMLQWSRNLRVAESVSFMAGGPQGRYSFNGAAT